MNMNVPDEAEEANTSSVDDVLLARQREVNTVKSEDNGRKLSVTVNEVLLVVERARGGANSSGESLDVLRRSTEKRGSGIKDSVRSGGHRLAIKGHAVKTDHPVVLHDERDPLKITLELGAVVVAELKSTVLAVSLAEVEGEEVLLSETLSEHVLERGGDVIDRDGLESHAEDTVELAHGEGGAEAGDISDFGEDLVLDLLTVHGKDIVGEVALNGARTVHDLELSAIGDERRGRVVVVSGVGAAVGAVNGRDPEVSRASVEDDAELLSRATDRDLTEVLSVEVVVDGDVTEVLAVVGLVVEEVDNSIDFTNRDSQSVCSESQSKQTSGSFDHLRMGERQRSM
jgi:hypothetical protein